MPKALNLDKHIEEEMDAAQTQEVPFEGKSQVEVEEEFEDPMEDRLRATLFEEDDRNIMTGSKDKTKILSHETVLMHKFYGEGPHYYQGINLRTLE